MKNAVWGTLSFVLPALAMGQCGGSQIFQPFGNCTEGYAYVEGCDPDLVDSVVWSNGQVGMYVDGLVPGSYSVSAYHDGQVVQTFPFEVAQMAWLLTTAEPYWTDNTGYTISGWAEVPGYAMPSYWPCCSPQDSLTYARLVQDGTTELPPDNCMGCTSMSNAGIGSMFWFTGVPTGHVYTVRLHDLSCGQVVEVPEQIVVNACDNLVLVHEETGTPPGAFQGGVQLLGAIPDTTEPYPLHAPVLGSATLFSGLEGYDVVGSPFNNVASASWTGLDTGYYRLRYTPNAACNQLVDTVYISSPTAIGEQVQTKALQILPTATRDQIKVIVPGEGFVAVHMLDAIGREVSLRAMGNGLYDTGSVPPGVYLIKVNAAGALLSARFLR